MRSEQKQWNSSANEQANEHSIKNEGLIVEFEYGGITDKGLSRENNQDQYLIADLHKSMRVQSSSESFRQDQLYGEAMGKLLFVADGVGGAHAGEVASELAIQSMAQFLLNSMHWLLHPKQPDIDAFIEDLKAGAMQSHEVVRGEAEREPDHYGMGTTLTVAYLVWPWLYVLHVGDSRCYLLRDETLQLLTKDQTLAQYLLDSGHLSGNNHKLSSYHNVLMSAIGAEGAPEAVVYKKQLLAGDRILLCSDGVNAHLQDADIQQVLGGNQGADAICKEFVKEANRLGGSDNITAVVAISKSTVV